VRRDGCLLVVIPGESVHDHDDMLSFSQTGERRATASNNAHHTTAQPETTHPFRSRETSGEEGGFGWFG
jgi:hypothetical protein